MQVFGLPSRRTDKVPPQQPSVAARDDYGNAATMDQVMKPRRQNQVADGLLAQRTPQEIRWALLWLVWHHCAMRSQQAQAQHQSCCETTVCQLWLWSCVVQPCGLTDARALAGFWLVRQRSDCFMSCPRS